MKRLTCLLPAGLMLLMAMLLTACNQKGFDTFAGGPGYYFQLEVTYDHSWHLVSEGGPDWQQLWDDEKYYMTYESLRPDDPTGLRTLIYHEDGSYDVFNLSPHGGVVDIRGGRHTLLLYNNDTEYILFSDLANAPEAFATTRYKSRAGYMGSPFVDENVNTNTIGPPDMLFACNGGELVTGEPGEVLITEYKLYPLVYKYVLRYHFDHGLQHVALGRGALAGMAAGVYLTDGRTSTEAATLLFDIEGRETMVVTDPETGAGVLYVVVNSFGAPGTLDSPYGRAETAQGLNLEVMLTNGVTKNFDFDITEQVRRQPRGGVIEVYGLEVDNEEADPGKGTFDVDVTDWPEDIEVPIM